MRDHTWETADEREFDAMLENSLPELPPADVVQGVTPWRRAMNRVLVGLALNTITLQFWGLQYILPAAGLLLMLLGLRSLRGENRWLQGCFVLVAVKAACFWPLLVLNATIYQGAVSSSPAYTGLSALQTVLTLLLYFCFWRGLQDVRWKAGLSAGAGSAAALLVWYTILCLLGLLLYGGEDIWGPLIQVAAILMLVVYICIIRGLRRLSRELDEAGYTIHPLPVRVTDSALAGIVLGVLAAGIACGYLFFSSYPMDWRAAEPSADAEAAEIRAQLLDLGFPGEVLNDLTEEDILACADAWKVVVQAEDLPLDINGGHMVEETLADGSVEERRVYDVTELRLTSVSVALPGKQWKLFHHFLWTVDPGFYGTEAVALLPAYLSEGWALAGDFSGRLLYDRAEKTYTAAYHSIESKTYTASSVFWGESTETRVFAAFSLPREGTGKRGYVSYTVQETGDTGGYFYCWVVYVHQKSWMQYPVMTAVEDSMVSSWGETAFQMVIPWLAFTPRDGGTGAAEG